VAHPAFGIIQKCCVVTFTLHNRDIYGTPITIKLLYSSVLQVTLDLGINDNPICCRSCAEDTSDEGPVSFLSVCCAMHSASFQSRLVDRKMTKKEFTVKRAHAALKKH